MSARAWYPAGVRCEECYACADCGRTVCGASELVICDHDDDARCADCCEQNCEVDE